jgi:hypothetical protein
VASIATAVAFFALLGILWHAAVVMINDGIQRRRYHSRVRALAGLPREMQSATRTAVMEQTRRRLSPFGRTFSKWWRRRHPGRGKDGRAYVANANVDMMALVELSGGCILAMSMGVWALVGATPVELHLMSLLGGTAGGVAGGSLCESAGLVMVLFGHFIGAGAGSAGLIGIARLTRKL